MHGLAYDDGTNAPGGFPVAHAGAFASQASAKGGPYTSGEPITGNKKYGLMDVTDTGAEIVATFYAWDTTSGSELLAPGWPFAATFAAAADRQVARPDGLVAAGAWTDQSGGIGDLAAAVDEAVASDLEYVHSSVGPTADVLELSLSDLLDPGSPAGHVLRYRIRSQDGRLAVSWAELEAPASTVP
jgi:hypothetical protein